VYVSGIPDIAIVVSHYGREITSDPDVVILTDEKSIKIEHIRQLQQQLSTQPLTQQGRLVVICPANKITRPAQQALLKLVEEPPPRTQMVLVTNSRQDVLPTIQSRCVITYWQSDEGLVHENTDSSLITQILDLNNTKQKVEFIQSLPSKREELLEILVAELRQPLPLTVNTKKAVQLKRDLIDVLEALQGNVSPSLCLEKWIL
jgi:DNA polymerase III delta prime subunit